MKGVMEIQFKEKLRKQFMKEAFGVDFVEGLPSTPKLGATSKLQTKEDYDKRIELMEKCNQPANTPAEKANRRLGRHRRVRFCFSFCFSFRSLPSGSIGGCQPKRRRYQMLVCWSGVGKSCVATTGSSISVRTGAPQV